MYENLGQNIVDRFVRFFSTYQWFTPIIIVQSLSFSCVHYIVYSGIKLRALGSTDLRELTRFEYGARASAHLFMHARASRDTMRLNTKYWSILSKKKRNTQKNRKEINDVFKLELIRRCILETKARCIKFEMDWERIIRRGPNFFWFYKKETRIDADGNDSRFLVRTRA